MAGNTSRETKGKWRKQVVLQLPALPARAQGAQQEREIRQ
jgi:hypothetical protein